MNGTTATGDERGAADEAPAAQPGPDWTLRALTALGQIVIGLLGRTWRYRTRNQEGWQRLRAENKPFLFALWHGGLLPLTFRHRDEGVVVLISEHRDGEIISRTVHRWGYRTIRGSTTRGAGRALLAMIRELEAGSVVAITPDGPRGPARTFQPGALIAAQRAGAPIVPILVHVNRAWKFGSWDRFLVPKPFATVTIAYGDPTMVRGATPREAADEAQRFESIMGAAQERADA